VWLPGHKTVIREPARGVTTDAKQLSLLAFIVLFPRHLSMAVRLLDQVALTQP
jgi:hypothetical protein